MNNYCEKKEWSGKKKQEQRQIQDEPFIHSFTLYVVLEIFDKKLIKLEKKTFVTKNKNIADIISTFELLKTNDQRSEQSLQTISIDVNNIEKQFERKQTYFFSTEYRHSIYSKKKWM